MFSRAFVLVMVGNVNINLNVITANPKDAMVSKKFKTTTNAIVEIPI